MYNIISMMIDVSVKSVDLEKIKELSNNLKVLSDANRLQILSLLNSGELCVCHIFERLHLPQNLASHHLKILRNAGFLLTRREGKWVYYKLNRPRLEKITSDFIAINE